MKKVVLGVAASMALAYAGNSEISILAGEVDPMHSHRYDKHTAYGVRVGVGLETALIDQIELGYDYSSGVEYRPDNPYLKSESALHRLYLNVIKELEVLKSLKLYALAGVGYETLQEDLPQRSRAFGQYGAGLKFYFTDNLAIRGELKQGIEFSSPNRDNIFYTVGFVYSFGSKQQETVQVEQSQFKPEPIVEESAPVEEVVEELLVIEEPAPVVEEPAPVAEVVEEPAPVEEVVQEPAPVVEEPALVAEVVEEPAPVEEVVQEPAPVVEEPALVAEVVEEPAPAVEELVVVEEPVPVVEIVEEPAPVEEVVQEPAPVVEEPAPVAEVVEEPVPVIEEVQPTLIAVPTPIVESSDDSNDSDVTESAPPALTQKSINFETDSAQIKDGAKDTLQGIADDLQLEEYLDVKVLVKGHADATGSDFYNLRLSQRRANAVKNELVKKGVAGDRITTRGYGEIEPIEPNSTREGRAANRRAEIIFQ